MTVVGNVGLYNLKITFFIIKNLYSDHAVYSPTSAHKVAVCCSSPFAHVDYFFSNLTLWMTVVGIVGLHNNLKSTFFIKRTLLTFIRSRRLQSHQCSQGCYLPSVLTLSTLELNWGVVTWRNEWDGLPFVGTSCNWRILPPLPPRASLRSEMRAFFQRGRQTAMSAIGWRLKIYNKFTNYLCIIKFIVRGNQAHVKNADLHHPFCRVVMYKRKSASPVHNVLSLSGCRAESVNTKF
jgi:hypothetical protein